MRNERITVMRQASQLIYTRNMFWRLLKIRCLTIRNHNIEGIPTDQSLETMEGEQIMVCDYDGIYRGSYNFKIYNRVAKFFETVVFNLVRREYDYVDSLVSGASRVIVDSSISDSVLEKIMEISPDVVMPYVSSERVEFFRSIGGYSFISSRQINGPFQICYNVGTALGSEKYVDVIGFPEDLLHFL